MIGKWMTQLIEWLIGTPDETPHPTDEEIKRLTKEKHAYENCKDPDEQRSSTNRFGEVKSENDH
jgi:hypothetical protein